jgi:hypothetical protein
MPFCWKPHHRLTLAILISLLTGFPANAQIAFQATGWIEVVKVDAVSYTSAKGSTSKTLFVLRTSNGSEPDYLLTADRNAKELNFESGPDHIYKIRGILTDIPRGLSTEIHLISSISNNKEEKRNLSNMMIVARSIAVAAPTTASTTAPMAHADDHGQNRVSCDANWPEQHKPDSEYQAYIKSCLATAETVPTNTAQASSTKREMVVVYAGDQNPGAGWTSSGMNVNQYERKFTVSVDVSTTAFPGWPARQGAKFYSLSLSQLGTLPVGKLYIGLADRWGIERGASVASMATSSGLMGMFVVNPSQTVVRWVER